MAEFEELTLNIQVGDIIKSKKGILLLNSPLTKKDYVVFEMEYLGKGRWKINGDKQEVTLS